MNTKQKKLLFILLLLAGGAVLRICFIQMHSAFMSSDEAIFGLMAKHIITRGELSVFMHGQSHAGSVIAYLAAPLFYLFGISNLIFKMVCVILSLLFCWLVYLLGRQIDNKQTSIFAFAFSIFCPAYLMFGSMQGAGSYIIMLLFGVAGLILCNDILFTKRLPQYIAYALLGLILGAGFWVLPLMVSFIASVWLVLFLKDRKCFFKISFLLFVLFFIIGNLPMIIYDNSPSLQAAGGIAEPYAWPAYKFLFGKANESLLQRILMVPANLFSLIRISWPALIGNSVWQYETGFLRRIISIILISFWSIVCFSMFKWRLGFLSNKKSKRKPELKPVDVLVFQFIFTFLIAAISRFQSGFYEPRYLVPSYVFLFIAVGFFIKQLFLKRKKMAYTILTLMLSLNIISCLWFSKSLDTEHGFWPKDQKLINYMIKNNINHPIANYWIAYQIAFETDEEVIPIPIGFYRFKMYEHVLDYPAPTHYVFRKRAKNDSYFEFFKYDHETKQWSAEEFSELLKKLNVPRQDYDVYEFDHYVLFNVPHKYLNPEKFILKTVGR